MCGEFDFAAMCGEFDGEFDFAGMRGESDFAGWRSFWRSIYKYEQTTDGRRMSLRQRTKTNCYWVGFGSLSFLP